MHIPFPRCAQGPLLYYAGDSPRGSGSRADVPPPPSQPPLLSVKFKNDGVPAPRPAIRCLTDPLDNFLSATEMYGSKEELIENYLAHEIDADRNGSQLLQAECCYLFFQPEGTLNYSNLTGRWNVWRGRWEDGGPNDALVCDLFQCELLPALRKIKRRVENNETLRRKKFVEQFILTLEERNATHRLVQEYILVSKIFDRHLATQVDLKMFQKLSANEMRSREITSYRTKSHSIATGHSKSHQTTPKVTPSNAESHQTAPSLTQPPTQVQQVFQPVYKGRSRTIIRPRPRRLLLRQRHCPRSKIEYV